MANYECPEAGSEEATAIELLESMIGRSVNLKQALELGRRKLNDLSKEESLLLEL